MDRLIELLARIEEPIDRGEDFNPAAWAGDNFDDAWTRGEEDGRRPRAAEIREILGLEKP